MRPSGVSKLSSRRKRSGFYGRNAGGNANLQHRFRPAGGSSTRDATVLSNRLRHSRAGQLVDIAASANRFHLRLKEAMFMSDLAANARVGATPTGPVETPWTS